MNSARPRVEGLPARFNFLPGSDQPLAQFLQVAITVGHARGTFCADCT
jgi:hypothetical protein